MPIFRETRACILHTLIEASLFAVLRRLQLAVTNVVDFGATPLSSLIGMRNRYVTKSNGVVEQKSSIRKLTNMKILRHRLVD